MKWWLSLVILSAGVLVTPTAIAQQADLAAALVPRTAHPYLTFSDANVARLKAQVATDADAQRRWAAVRKTADAALAKSPADGRPQQLALESLALSYRMTRDPRYADAARKMLATFAAQPSWLRDVNLLRRTPPWKSDLFMAFSAASFGIAYDAVYDRMTPDERKTLAAGLIRGAIAPIMNDWVDGAQRIHSLDSMGHNWWGHIVFGGGIGAMAVLGEDPRASEWVGRTGEAEAEWFDFAGTRIGTKPATWGDDGSYSESVHYADLGLHHMLLFRRSWAEVLDAPQPELPVLERITDYMIAAAYPRTGGAISLNFGDSKPQGCSCQIVADLWLLGGRKTPRSLWYDKQFEYLPVEDVWSAPTFLPFLPTPAERSAAATLEHQPTAAIYPDAGMAALRSGWQPDATMLALKSGFTWNHNHAEANHFILDHAGQRLLIDPGNPPYVRPEYDAYFRTSAAANVVTLDGEAEPHDNIYAGSHDRGEVGHLIDAGTTRYVWADATGPTARTFARNYRHVLWIGDAILLIDDVRGYAPGQFRWQLHYDGTATRKDDVVTIAREGASVEVRPLFPQPLPAGGLASDYPEAMRMVSLPGMVADPKIRQQDYLAFEPTEKTQAAHFVVALTPRLPGETPPVIERFEGIDYQGIRLRQNGKVTEVYVNLPASTLRHRNANASFGGFETDAAIFAVTYADGADRNSAPLEYLVADASYLRRGDTVYLDSLSKTFVDARRTGDALALVFDGQPNLDVRLGCMGAATVAVRDAAPLACTAGHAVLRRRTVRP